MNVHFLRPWCGLTSVLYDLYNRPCDRTTRGTMNCVPETGVIMYWHSDIGRRHMNDIQQTDIKGTRPVWEL